MRAVADERVHSEGVWLPAQTCHVGFRWWGGMRGAGSRPPPPPPPCCDGELDGILSPDSPLCPFFIFTLLCISCIYFLPSCLFFLVF